MKLKIRRTMTVTDTREIDDAGERANPPLLRVAVGVVVENPFVGRYVADLKPMIEGSVEIGALMGEMAVKALGSHKAESYGKAGIVGINGEQEHANALLTTEFANPIRKAIGGGKGWISSMTKVAVQGTTIDVPMNHKDAIYVRSHYDGMTLTFHDSPKPDEILLIMCLANRGRLNARVGGLAAKDAKGEDGLV
ncbi:MAG TPA: amino acid synthesis family protein [Burkholderiales bacterium]|jgi:hypothetical protein